MKNKNYLLLFILALFVSFLSSYTSYFFEIGD